MRISVYPFHFFFFSAGVFHETPLNAIKYLHHCNLRSNFVENEEKKPNRFQRALKCTTFIWGTISQPFVSIVSGSEQDKRMFQFLTTNGPRDFPMLANSWGTTPSLINITYNECCKESISALYQHCLTSHCHIMRV